MAFKLLEAQSYKNILCCDPVQTHTLEITPNLYIVHADILYIYLKPRMLVAAHVCDLQQPFHLAEL